MNSELCQELQILFSLQYKSRHVLMHVSSRTQDLLSPVLNWKCRSVKCGVEWDRGMSMNGKREEEMQWRLLILG
jgi:hypothetical protein